MRKVRTMAVVLMVLAGSIFAMPAWADGSSDPGDPGLRCHRGPDGPGVLARYVRLNMAAQSLSEMTGQPADLIRTRLQRERLPDLLAEYHVNRAEFSRVMHGKIQDLLGKLVEGHYLTAEQRDRMVARMDQYAQRRALLKSLIDKGVQDGTLSADQAQTLFGKPQ